MKDKFPLQWTYIMTLIMMRLYRDVYKEFCTDNQMGTTKNHLAFG